MTIHAGLKGDFATHCFLIFGLAGGFGDLYDYTYTNPSHLPLSPQWHVEYYQLTLLSATHRAMTNSIGHEPSFSHDPSSSHGLT